MTAHWVEVKENKWKMRSAVIGFKALSGAHSGENLGRYAVGLLDRVGIMDKKRSKACQYVNCHVNVHQITDMESPFTSDSFTRQHWTTPVIIIQHVRPLRKSMFAEVLSGTAKNNNCRVSSSLVFTNFLVLIYLFLLSQLLGTCCQP